MLASLDLVDNASCPPGWPGEAATAVGFAAADPTEGALPMAGPWPGSLTLHPIPARHRCADSALAVHIDSLQLPEVHKGPESLRPSAAGFGAMSGPSSLAGQPWLSATPKRSAGIRR
jgi:hypothetical protein